MSKIQEISNRPESMEFQYRFEQVDEQNLKCQRMNMMKIVWNSYVLYVKFQKSYKKSV